LEASIHLSWLPVSLPQGFFLADPEQEGKGVVGASWRKQETWATNGTAVGEEMFVRLHPWYVSCTCPAM